MRLTVLVVGFFGCWISASLVSSSSSSSSSTSNNHPVSSSSSSSYSSSSPHSSLFPSIVGGSTNVRDHEQQQQPESSSSPSSSSSSLLLSTSLSKTDNNNNNNNNGNNSNNDNDIIYIRKRDGQLEELDGSKIYKRLQELSKDFPDGSLNLTTLTQSVLRGMYPNVTTMEIDTLAAETAASMATQHMLYSTLAARILVSQNHKITPSTFSECIVTLHNQTNYIDANIVDLVRRRSYDINKRIVNDRDYEYITYFGFKTLERSYLLKNTKEDGIPLERPQYLLMRVALGIHCTVPPSPLSQEEEDDDTKSDGNNNNKVIRFTKEEEDRRLEAAFQTYDMMSQGYFMHASPTLFHSGTTHPQLSSCFLVQMSDDSISGIYDTLKRCAVISKAAGGIGLSVHNIRARGTPIRGTRGVSNGLVPMLRVYDVTSRYVDQGGGKRPGAFAIYLEPWHADILDVLNLKKNHGKEEQRARDLFYGLWIPDLFMKRVENDEMWSLMCPDICPGLSECHGDKFERLYCQYENEGRFVRQMRAREVWSAILESQIETGTPYMLYKDAANAKSNQQNIGTIQCSNLCTEIIQYTDEEEVAVCNLASICLPKFVVSDRGPFGSVVSDSGRAYFDHEGLHRVAKIVTRNLNKIIDINSYPLQGAKTSNHRHRPIGIGVSGLADAFIRLGLPFASDEAKELNEAIFETIYHAALEASAELAEEESCPYETFQGSPASRGELQFDLWGVNEKDLPSVRLSYEASKGSKAAMHSFPDFCASKGYDWKMLKEKIMTHGMRNSLLLAPMPTASTSQILGVNECFEPFSSNLYLRRVKAGEFIMANPHLMQDLLDRGLWTPTIRNQLMRDGGSVANIESIPPRLKELYKTVWEIKMKNIIDMAVDRGKFVDQSQSLNLFIADPTADKLTAMHFYAWKQGLKTGMYYLRTKPAVNAIQYTVEKETSAMQVQDESQVCISCQS